MENKERPIRVGIFNTFVGADQAVRDLLNAHFTREEITVIAPKHLEGQFKAFEHQKDKKDKALLAGALGGAIGVLGGLTAAVGVVATGGVALLAIGPLFAGTGALVGGFVGVMMRRGVEKELAHFYDQAVSRGKILVAAEAHGEHQEERLTIAELIFAKFGSQPLSITEG